MPLAFANVVKSGDIGIVAASGTAPGGFEHYRPARRGREPGDRHRWTRPKKDIGGLMMKLGLDALKSDPKTKVITLISKPQYRDRKRNARSRQRRASPWSSASSAGIARKSDRSV
ncbi:MAG: hypothetical protein R2912_08465 [Eubacteriales bacterium]